jgi:two-component system, OmpR family, sensor histidine kinase KdpD
VVSPYWKRAKVAVRLSAALAVIAAITFLLFRVVKINATTVGFAYLVAILIIATVWGLLEATVASVLAVLCFNYFFFPPVGSFTIADPQNWVALLAFLVTSIIASQLSARAKYRTQEALERQRDMERLYALSRAILLAESNRTATKQIARQIAQIFDFRGVALYEREPSHIHYAGPEDLTAIEEKLRLAASQGTQFRDELDEITVTSIRLGGQPIGSLAIRGPALSDGALQALSNLVAIGLEKVRTQEAANRAEAARESGELKSTLLDAIAHEFKTPLTPIKAAVTSMLADGSCNPTHQELLRIVNEETDRLNSMLNEAIHMARIQAGKVQLQSSPHTPASLITPSLERLHSALEGRKVEVHIPDDLPLVMADPELVGIVLWQLLSNAIRYTPPGSAMAVRARAQEDWVVISVLDSGPGISTQEQSHIFEKFYRSKVHRNLIPGSGMGLAIAREIIRAHGGKVWVESEPGRGSEFFLTLPLAGKVVAP